MSANDPARAGREARPIYRLHHLAELCYRWGDCAAILYDQVRTELFPPPFLDFLYDSCLHSGRAKLGILAPLFCGMQDLSRDAICAYLHTRRLVILGEWQRAGGDDEKHFHPLGFCFLTTESFSRTEHSAFGAYAFFQEAWGTEQQRVLTILGIAHLLQENNLCALHGVRYAENALTARWMRQFGFEDCGRMPSYLADPRRGGEFADAVFSTLSRKRFEEWLGEALALGERLEEPEPEQEREPAPEPEAAEDEERQEVNPWAVEKAEFQAESNRTLLTMPIRLRP